MKKIILMIAMMVFSIPAFAQEDGYRYFSPLSHSPMIVNLFISRANDELPTIKGSERNTFAPVTQQEAAMGVIDRELAQHAIDRGVFSAFLQLCQINWEKRSFQPFAVEMQKTQHWDERQMAYARRLHDIGMMYLRDGFAKSGETCGALVQKNVGTYLLHLKGDTE